MGLRASKCEVTHIFFPNMGTFREISLYTLDRVKFHATRRRTFLFPPAAHARHFATMEHESDGFERAFKLAEEHKFDELLEHLRVDDPRYGRLVDTCVRDERLLPVCARAGVPALEVIEPCRTRCGEGIFSECGT